MKTPMKHAIILTFLIFISVIMQGCSGDVIPPLGNNDKIKIGIMTMTSGDLAFLGTNIVRSAKLAAEDLGYNESVEFVIEDVGNLGDGRTTVSAYKKLVEVDDVHFIIDGMTSDGTLSIAPLLDQDHVVMITPLTGGENIDNSAEFLFRNGPSDIQAGLQPANDLDKRFNITNIALLTDNAEYTLDIASHLRNNFRRKIVSDQIIEPDKTDYRTEILKIPASAQAIVINTASGTSAAYILKELHEHNNSRIILANFLAFNSNTVKIAGDGMEGVYIYDPEFDETSTKTKAFFAQYNQTYGFPPTIPFHATGTYDALRMGVTAIREVGYDGQKMQKWLLENVHKWNGLNGNISFDKNGNTESGFVLKQVRNGTLVRV